MSLALGPGGRLISRPATTSDLVFSPQPHEVTHSSPLSSPKQIYRRGDDQRGGIKARGGADPLDSSFGLGLCLHAIRSDKTHSSSYRKTMKRFCRMYFRRQSFAAAEAGGVGSGHPEEEADLLLDGDGGSYGDGGDGGKEGNGGNRGGGGFDGGDLKLEAFPFWWWWQSKLETGSAGKRLEIDIPIEIGRRPEKKVSERGNKSSDGEKRVRWWRRFLGKLKKALGKFPEKIMKAILLPFVWTAIVISEPASRRFYRECFRPFVPFPIAFVRYFFMSLDYFLAVTFLLMTGTSLLLLTLLLWWAWRHHLGGGSAGDNDGIVDQYSQEDYGGDED